MSTYEIVFKIQTLASIFTCSRQFLQSLCIGKAVSFKIEYTVRSSCRRDAILPYANKIKKNADWMTIFFSPKGARAQQSQVRELSLRSSGLSRTTLNFVAKVALISLH